ncbi:MAG: proteasome accessory factor PafA2 family protein, partial [Planctomycetaceae bacterium]
MIPKYLGRDCELSTTGVDAQGGSIDPGRVTREVLRHIPDTLAAQGTGVVTERGRFTTYSMDCCRNWGSNGQCHYADMSHVECCTPLCLNPFDFGAHSLAMVQVAEAARRRAQADSDERATYSLSTSNADMLDPSISFGTHLSVCIEQDLWEDLFHAYQRPSRLAMVASGLAAAIPFFGAGHLLPWKDRTTYSLSARAHHLTRVVSASTTEAFQRGMLNSRREAHGKGVDRLHLIGFDLCLLSGPLLASFVQCLLAAAEENFCGLQLAEPVKALRRWSWGLDLSSGRMPERAVLVDGRHLTLPEYLEEMTHVLLRMCESGLIGPDIAPRASELLPRIIGLARQAGAGAIDECARHLTWASKLLCLLSLCEQQGAELGDATTRLADHDFSNTDPNRGPIWSLWDQGVVDPLVTPEAVAAAWKEPPADTRDAIRGRILTRFTEAVSDVNWSSVELREADDHWGPRLRIDLPSLDRASCAAIGAIVDRARSVEELARELKRLRAGWSRDPLDDFVHDLDLPDSLPAGNM